MKKYRISKLIAVIAVVALTLTAFAGCGKKGDVGGMSVGEAEKAKLVGKWTYVGNVAESMTGKSTYAKDGEKYGEFTFGEDDTLKVVLYKEDGSVRTERTYKYKVTDKRYLKTYDGEKYIGPDYKISWVEDELRLFEYWREEENNEDSPYKKNDEHNGYILEK